jgi:hypothetical protein
MFFFGEKGWRRQGKNALLTGLMIGGAALPATTSSHNTIFFNFKEIENAADLTKALVIRSLIR